MRYSAGAWVLLGMMGLIGRGMADEAGKDDSKLGAYHVVFTERSPLSTLAEQCRRYGWTMQQVKNSGFEADYGLVKESFEVNVPKSYKAGEPGWGLMVWVSAGDSGGPVREYAEILEKRKLIWVGANGAGNPRAMWCRIGLAVDAAQNMKKRYTIDPNRVYVAGASGGGRISSIVGVGYPDVFSGGMYIIGCNFYRDMEVPDKPGTFWRKTYSAPPGKLFTDAKQKSRHVLLEGETDMNRAQAKENYEKGFKKDGFLHVTYLEVPGMGHQSPPLDWFEKGLDALEAPPLMAKSVGEKPSQATPAAAKSSPPEEVASREQPAKQGPGSASSGRSGGGGGVFGDASSQSAGGEADLTAAKELARKDVVAGYAALQKVVKKYPESETAVGALKEIDALDSNPVVRKKIESAQEADKLLRVSRVYIDNKLYGPARERLTKIVTDYPDTPSVKEAKELLKQIEKSG